MTTMHPLDWKSSKKTSYPLFCLAMAIAWHKRESLGDDYVGLVADPAGVETLPCDEQAYDSAIAEAQQVLAQAKAEAAKRNVPAKFVRVLCHPDAMHAVVVRLPGGADTNAYIAEMRNAPEGGELQAKTFAFANRLLWPLPGSSEAQDLQDLFGIAFQLVYPDELQKLAGFRGVDVKKLG